MKQFLKYLMGHVVPNTETQWPNLDVDSSESKWSKTLMGWIKIHERCKLEVQNSPVWFNNQPLLTHILIIKYRLFFYGIIRWHCHPLKFIVFLALDSRYFNILYVISIYKCDAQFIFSLHELILMRESIQLSKA